jgi:hypothetical protein
MARVSLLGLVAAATLAACGGSKPSGSTASPVDANERNPDLAPERTADAAAIDTEPPVVDAGGADRGAATADAPKEASVDAASATDADAGRPDGGRVPYRAIAVTTGDVHTCALLDDHNVKCWGDDEFGQLGYGDKRTDRGGAPSDMGDALPIVDLGTGRTAAAIVAGRYTTCAILDDGSVKCWGEEGLTGQPAKGNIGDGPGEMGDNLAPLDFGGRKAAHLAIGHYAACASMSDDTIWCWGAATTPTMVGVGPTKKVKALSESSSGGVFALYDDGTVGTVIVPGDDFTTLTGPHKALAIAGTLAAPTCAVLDNGTTTCLTFGVLRDIGAPIDTVAVGVGGIDGDICTVSADGTVHGALFCENLRDGVPYWCVDTGKVVALGQPAVAVTSGGEDFTCALLEDGGIKCWGGDPTKPPFPQLGSEIAFTQTDAGLAYGAWHSVDLGTHP